MILFGHDEDNVELFLVIETGFSFTPVKHLFSFGTNVENKYLHFIHIMTPLVHTNVGEACVGSLQSIFCYNIRRPNQFLDGLLLSVGECSESNVNANAMTFSRDSKITIQLIRSPCIVPYRSIQRRQ